MKFGLILVAVGVIMLLKQFGFIGMVDWDIVWPVALIVIGLGMMFKKRSCMLCGMIHGGMCTPKQ